MLIKNIGVNNMDKEKTIINYKGQSVWCYGDLKDEDNIEMVWCEGECSDIVDNDNEITGLAFKNWTECVRYLIDLERFGEIDELSTC